MVGEQSGVDLEGEEVREGAKWKLGVSLFQAEGTAIG